MLFINFYFLPVTFYLRFCLNGCTVDHKSLSNKMLLEHTLISHLCQDSLSRAHVSAVMLLIFKCWLNWVKKETWTKFFSEFLK